MMIDQEVRIETQMKKYRTITWNGLSISKKSPYLESPNFISLVVCNIFY